MRSHAKSAGWFTLMSLLLVVSPAIAQKKEASEKKESEAKAAKVVTVDDMKVWKSLRSTTVSNDGKWFASVTRPGEGDSELAVYDVQKGEEKRIPIGASSGGGVAFSHDSKWLAYVISPTDKETKQAQQTKKPIIKKAAIMNLASGEKVEVERAESLAFAGERGQWLAIRVAGAPGGTPAKDAGAGSDLLLYELASGKQLNLGNIREYRFNKAGTWLAMVIDAAGKAGNGVQLRDMCSGAIVPLENDQAKYSRLSWTKEGDALAVLKAVEDKDFEQPLLSVIGWKKFDEGEMEKHSYDPKKDDQFPKEMTISPNRGPTWTENRQAILFGIHEAKPKKSEKPGEKKEEPSSEKDKAKQEASKSDKETTAADQKVDGAAAKADTKSQADQPKAKPDEKNGEVKSDSKKEDTSAKQSTRKRKRRGNKGAKTAGKKKPAADQPQTAAKRTRRAAKTDSSKNEDESAERSKKKRREAANKDEDAAGKKKERKRRKSAKGKKESEAKPEPKKAEDGDKEEGKPEQADKGKTDTGGKPEAKPPAKAASKEQKPAGLVIWHWKDKRLQSQQQKEESRDKRFNYLAVYNLDSKKFVRLADDELRNVSVNEKHRWAIGQDDSEYKLEGSLNGRRYQDIYVLDLATGQKWLAVKKCRWYYGASPDGDRLLYFADGHFHAYDIPSRTAVNITKDAPVSFVDEEADYIDDQPPVRPLGWSSDSAFAILSDSWDLWAIPSIGGQATNLTKTGKRDGVRFRSHYRLDPEEKGFDLSKPAYLRPTASGQRKAAWPD